MKHLLLILSALVCSLPSLAQLNGNGFYRVQNYKTGRYVYVTDDKGKLDYQASTADMGAIELWKSFEKACSDPATVCFIEKHGEKYDIRSQGTGVYEIIDSYVNIRDGKDGTYYAYGSKDGITKYLSDGEQADIPEGVMSDAGKGDQRKWYIIPMGTGSDNFFGIKPTLKAEGTNYASFYTAFPYSFASEGMKAYYVIKVINGYAVLREIKGTVPAYTPVIVKMSSDQPANNKLNIGGSAQALGDNLLKGVFFNNPTGSHRNQTAYNASTMRMLGVKADGKLGFVTSDISFIPANHVYLPVAQGTEKELTLISEEEYNQLNSKKPESIVLSETKLTMIIGEKHQLKATVLPEEAFDKSVNWGSNDKSKAVIDNDGVITAMGEGVVRVFGETVNGIKAYCEVVVKKPTEPDGIILSETHVEMTVGDRHRLTAKVTPDNAYDKTVSWGSNDKSIAEMDNDGVITAKKAGVVRVLGTTVNGITAYCEVVVKDPVAPDGIVLSEDHVKMFIGEKHKLTAKVTPDDAHDKTVSWGSNDKKIAVIDNDGVITALSEGVVRVLATTVNGITAYCEVVVTKEIKPIDISLDQTQLDMNVGDKVQLKATVYPEDASNKSVTWSTNNEGVASVDKDGVVTATGEGSAKVTAISSNGLKANCYVNVTNKVVPAESIVLDKNVYEAVEGSEFVLTATILPENATVKTVAWSSSDINVAMVSDGKVKVLKEGTATITAATTDGTDLKDECIVTVISGIEEIFADGASFPVKVYTAGGILVKTAMNIDDIRNLGAGVYIINNKKIVIAG